MSCVGKRNRTDLCHLQNCGSVEGTISFLRFSQCPSTTRCAPKPGHCPLTLARVLAGRPGTRGGVPTGAPERDGARPAWLLRVAGSSRPLAWAARALRPPVPALARALPRPRSDAHFADPGPRLARSLAHPSDCRRAPDPRAGGGRPGGDQCLSRRGPALPWGRPRALLSGRWGGRRSQRAGRGEVSSGAHGVHGSRLRTWMSMCRWRTQRGAGDRFGVKPGHVCFWFTGSVLRGYGLCPLRTI